MRVSVELKGCAAGLGIRKTVMGEIKEQIIGNRKGERNLMTPVLSPACGGVEGKDEKRKEKI